ncbi:SDR family NAD(P)-dependent oxidoreductase [Guptibacillus hwajinpoensis]|uniref:NAD(P)-dependent dehydrogenase (Short-subunit alcohol dehydrogenase family) n=1 Tax=Guptibacillus hwajinpoensis TaxID=208199 RepID=A0ABU0K5F3_9BACL|nr:SDR family oxidoreductase [Alkalihalobacillus hemicentroti]MDQ0483357.1 NAD(P)-dependent dehydrogenase (short-subunit alcohol dehydrogenase family) [Alkalihalobacillus hemicentroti]
MKEVVIVTGAGHGIGRGVAIAYSEKGSQVILADVNEAGCKETARLMKDEASDIIVTDVSNPDQIQQLMNQTEEKYGRLDVLVNNAGLTAFKQMDELSVEEWDHVINTNLRSVFLGSRAAATLMRKSGGGSIINIASTRASMSEPNSEAYAATKGGIVALSHALAISLSKDQITVNSISPGWIEVEDYASLRDIDHDQHPSGRVGKPSDIGRACLFLSNTENDFVTGENLVIDGGMTRKMIYEH